MESREQAEQAAVRWIARRETGAWGAQDAAAFDEWLSGAMIRRVAYYRFKKTWQESGRLKAFGTGPLPDRPLSEVFDLPSIAPAHKSARRFMRPTLAAAFVLAVATVPFVLRHHGLGLESYSTVVGGLTAVPMPDGSRVTLNTDSRLRFSVDGRERRIELERGEAFFEVAKDPNRPFIVAAGEQRVIAVGTQFSVRREGDDVRVSVTEGAVRLLAQPSALSTRQPPGVLLAAGSVATAEGPGVIVRQKPVGEIEQQLTWRAGILTFRDTALVDAVAEFNRYSKRKIFIEDPVIAAIKVGGIFRSTDMDPFIRLIEGSLPIQVSRQGDRIVLSSRGS